MSSDIEDQLRQYYQDTATTVGADPNLASNAVRTGTARRRRHRGAAVGAAVAASLGLVLAVPMVQSAMRPAQRVSSISASVPAAGLPQIATSSWQPGDGGRLAGLHARLGLSKDGRCLVVGEPPAGTAERWTTLVVWPKGYSVVLRHGQVTVLDQAGAEVARVGDVITAGGGLAGAEEMRTLGGSGPAQAKSCGLGLGFNIESKVSSTRP
jgi:hypothetical protein